MSRGTTQLPQSYFGTVMMSDTTGLARETIQSPDLGALFKAAPSLYLVLAPNDPDFTIVAASDAFTTATHIKPDDLIGKGLFDAFPENRDLMTSLRAAVKTKSPQTAPGHHYDFQGVDSMGQRYWGAINTPLCDIDGSVTCILHSLTDVTSAMQPIPTRQAPAQRPAEATAARLTALVGSSRDAIIAYTLDGVITDWNLGAEDLYGYTAEEAIGKSLYMMTPESKRGELHQVLSHVSIGDALRYETVRVDKNNQAHEVSITTSPMIDPTGEVIGGVSIIRDITEQNRTIAALKQSEQSLKEQADILQRSNEQLEQFAYVASHDLQEPLRMVASYTQLLRRRYASQLDATANEYIEFAVDGANRMQALIKDLLEFSRVDRRGAPLKPTQLSDVLATVIRDCQLLIKDAGAEIVVGELPTVLADRAQMVQVFENLCTNALKFRKVDVTPRIEIEATLIPDKWMWSITFKDNGIGFDQKFSERIFEMFERLNTRKEYPGTGIGLAIVRRIIERHGGTIAAQSEPGAGSVFTMTLRATEESEAQQ